jgi:hypothetical protein
MARSISLSKLAVWSLTAIILTSLCVGLYANLKSDDLSQNTDLTPNLYPECNNLLQEIENLVKSTSFNEASSYPFNYLIRKNGNYFEAIDSTHNLSFGGEDNVGCVDGTDLTAVIQAAVTNTNAGTVIVKNVTKIICEPLTMKSNVNLVSVVSTLTMPNLTEAIPISNNVREGADRIYLSDTSSFRVGQHITFTDDTRDFQYTAGNPYMVGNTYEVTAVKSNYVSIYPTIKPEDEALTTENARAIPAYSIIVVPKDAENITLSGFTLDGNRENRVNIQPRRPGSIDEDRGQDCLVSISEGATNVTIRGNYLLNAVLHGISTDGWNRNPVDNITIEYNYIDNAWNKNVLFFAVNDSSIERNVLSNSTWEDGASCYYGNQNLKIRENYIAGNHRFGILLRGQDCTVFNNTIVGTGLGKNVGGVAFLASTPKSANNRVIANNISTVHDGLAFLDCNDHASVALNIINDCVTGINIERTDYVVITGNIITNASLYAIVTSEGADYAVIIENDFTNQTCLFQGSIEEIAINKGYQASVNYKTVGPT